MAYRFVSNRGAFMSKHERFMELLVSRIAMQGEVILKTSAGMPVLTGNMKSQTRHFKNARGNYRLEIDVEYAAYQEAGRRADGSHQVTRYSTSGTSAGFFTRTIEQLSRNYLSYVREAKQAVNL